MLVIGIDALRIVALLLGGAVGTLTFIVTIGLALLALVHLD